MAKRGNNIYHRADGRWEGRFYCKGTKKYRSVYGRSYTETKEKLDKLRSEVLVPSVRCVLLVVDILKMWLEARRPSIKESSYAGYRHKLEKHLIPYFDKMKYNRLDLSGISKFITDKLTEGLSPKYISDMVIMVKSAARWAEITYNYANQVKNAKLPKKKTKEASFFSPAEQKKIISTVRAEHSNTGCGVMLTLFTGMRIGETCALKWADIDFDGKMLHVTKTVQRIATDVLREYRGKDTDYILSGTEKVVEPRCFSNRYKALLKKADVPSRKYHSLRHTFAVNALHQDFDIKTLSELLGHSNANITMSVYLHSSMDRKSACMDRLQALV